MNSFKKIGLLIIVFVITFIVLTFNTVNAAANEVDIKPVDIYNATNTYEYKYDEKILGYEPNSNDYRKIEYNNSRRYNFNAQNKNAVESGEARITILTHGLGSNPSDWSNDGNGNFSYTSDSLITRLYNMVDSYVYWMYFKKPDEETKEHNSLLEYEYTLHDITNQMSSAVENEPFKRTTSTSIVDVSKHIIIVFDAVDSLSTNDYIYSQFNFGISEILYQYKKLNNDILPKLNLIGHSRGGVTNMQYALDHPALIDSMYSLGTPYCGSTSASVDALLFDYAFGGPEGGEDDIIDETIYSQYINEWNDNYERYENINVLALGGYSTVNFLGYMCLSNPTKNMIKIKLKVDDNIAQAIVAMLDLLFLDIEKNYYSTENMLKEAYTSMLYKGFENIASEFNLSKYWIDDVVSILVNEIKFKLVNNKLKLVFENDVFVNLDSQLGYYDGSQLNDDTYDGYRGFRRISKCFTAFNCDINKTAKNLASIVHNLETRDTELLSYIISDIKLATKSFETYFISSNQVGLLAYTGNSSSNTLVLPSKINGKDVVEIGQNCFSGVTNVTSIVIPSTITKIHDSAFANCVNLAEINFESDSKLTYIGSNAFENCRSLSTIDLPISLNSFGDTPFAGSSIKIISSKSSYFPVENNTVYNINKTEVIYSPSCSSLTLPSSVLTIRNYAFQGNVNLDTINLTNVEKIGDYAFEGCINLTNINGNNVKKANKTAFLDTKWLEINDEAIIGSVLVEYKGDLSVYSIPDYIEYIAPSSFVSDELEIIYISNSVETIGNFAFIGAESLSDVYLLDICRFSVSYNSFNEGLNLYVAASDFSYYLNDLIYSDFNISTITQTVNLYIDGTLVDTIEVDYYENIPELPYLKKGYTIKYWLFNDKKYYVGNQLDILQPIIDLDAYSEPNVYKVYLEDYFEIYVTYGLFIPSNPSYGLSKVGYTFLGWYTSDNVCYINEYGTPSRKWNLDKDATLYAKWNPIKYSITYDLNGGTAGALLTVFMNNNSSYNIETNTIKLNYSPEKFGYKFRGWQDSSGNFVTQISKGTYGNIILKAIWYGDNYSVYSSSTSVSVTARYAVIQLPTTNFTSSCKISISGSCEQLYILTGNKNVIYNMYIQIQNIGRDFELYLNGVKMKAPTGCHGIEYNYSRYLNIHIKDSVSITGGNGAMTSFNGENGKDGINCYYITISGSGTIIVIGGNGANGSSGTNGTKGANGTKGPSGSFLSPKPGDSGQDGGNGTNGGNGGNGGYGIYAKYSISITGVSYTFTGGNGGNGGKGGNGGNGGNGASDTSTNIFNGVGEPGDGGDGGNGGSGGKGGNGGLGLNLSSYSSTQGLGGNGGTGGTGGDGGSGGSAGDYGSDGTPGDGGKGGSGGTGGSGYISGNVGSAGKPGSAGN